MVIFEDYCGYIVCKLQFSLTYRAYFFGDVSPKDRPNSYIRFVHILYQYYNEHHRDVPLIVNTHGWIKGIVRLFCFVLFCFVLFCFVLFCYVLL